MESGVISPKNTERISRVFYDAAKIVHERQKQLHKPQLKMKEISSALVLAESLHSRAFHFEATDKLAECFGQFDEDKALEYYEKHVMGEITDRHGRTIKIDEDGIKSLYKEPGSGKHIVATENYEAVRGKRLPWIRYTLENSNAIYVNEETVHQVFRRSFLYTAIVSIPLDPKPQTSYYVAVVREEKNEALGFVTAYSMFKLNSFLGVLALSRPFRQMLGE